MWLGIFLIGLFPFSRAYANPCGQIAQLATPAAQREFTISPYVRYYRPVLSEYGPHKEIVSWHVDSLPEKGVVLDAGGGPAITRDQALQKKHALKYYILDRSSEMLGKAMAYGTPAEQLIRGDATNIPMKSESIDHVVSDKMLYLLEPEKVDSFLREALRVLKPGGTFSLSSMRAVTDDHMAAFLQSMHSEIGRLESQGKIVDEHGQRMSGAADAFLGTPPTLTNRNGQIFRPTVFTNEEIAQKGTIRGFECIESHRMGYQGTAFFVVFRKPKPRMVFLRNDGFVRVACHKIYRVFSRQFSSFYRIEILSPLVIRF